MITTTIMIVLLAATAFTATTPNNVEQKDESHCVPEADNLPPREL